MNLIQWFTSLTVRSRLFTTMIALILLVEVVSGLIFQRHLAEWQLEQAVNQGVSASRAIATQLTGTLDREGARSLEAIVRSSPPWLTYTSAVLEARLSLISPSGVLLYDSALSGAELARASAHNDRAEVIAAQKGEVGIARRRSETVRMDQLYIASAITGPRGEHLGVVRLAKSAQHLDDQLTHLQRVLWSIFGLSLALALLISGWAARMLSQTLRRLMYLARDLSADVGDNSPDLKSRDEYSRLAHSLTKIATQLEDQVIRLAESRDRFETVLDTMREGVIALDGHNQISLANLSACRLMGWSTPPLNAHIDECIREESLLLFMHKQFEDEAPWVELEFRGRKTVLAQLTAQPNHGEAVLVLSDITALRRLETVRRDFVANVSHELRTPTTIIQANAETLLDGAMEDPSVAIRFLEGINRNAQRLAHLVSDLLDLSRIESGTYKLRAEHTTPREVIERVLDSLADQLIAKRLKVKITTEEGLDLYQDTGALEQVFTNLIENAVSYSHERGRVEVKAARYSREGEGEVSREKRAWIRIEVIDNGPGIAQVHKDRIFERFYRVDKGRSRQLGGTGLGLSIVKHLCHAMGGEVGVESQEGEGCTFWIHIPCEMPNN